MKYFGTDGIRRKGEFFLEENFLFRFANAVTKTFFISKVVIGKDTRESGCAISQRLAQAFRDLGVEVFDLGIVPTPEVCYYTKDCHGAVGVMISASHNPPEYNGLKVINSRGVKIAEEQEQAIEKQIDNPIMTLQICHADYHAIDGAQDYMNRVCQNRANCLNGQKILLDCAYGSAVTVAKDIFEQLGAKVDCVGDKLLGNKINCDCGATCLDNILQKSKAYDLALAFDGDADRVIAVKNGVILDGDDIIYNLAIHKGLRLVAVTVMSNYGLDTAFNCRGIDVVRVSVGDKYVQEAVLSGRAEIGAEQSGHIILSDEYFTGDGILAGVEFASAIANGYLSFQKLAQCLINIKADPKILEWIDFADITKQVTNLGGRILIRPSGTESVIRVLVEAKQENQAKYYANAIKEMLLNVR